MISPVSAVGDWLVRLTSECAVQSWVICFPNAGGSATAFRSWSSRVPADIEVLAVQFPGRQKRIREAPFRDLHAAVEGLLPAIAPLSGPNTVFFGDCTGALVAYEAIRAGAASGIPLPRHFLVSCCRAPDLQPRHEPLHALDEPALIAQIRQLSFAPEWLLNDAATLRSFLPLLRCDFELAESYVHRPGNALPIPITAVAGTWDKITPETDVSAWKHHTSASFDFIPMEGSHDLALTRVDDMLVLVEAAVNGSNGL